MATDEPRRSTRVRTQVKSYADEQAEERDKVVKAKASKGKRKSNADDDEVQTKKPAKKAKKAAKSTDVDDDTTATNAGARAAKASSSKPKRTATNSSWHGDAAERRIAVTNCNIRRLAEGQEERRLRR